DGGTEAVTRQGLVIEATHRADVERDVPFDGAPCCGEIVVDQRRNERRDGEGGSSSSAPLQAIADEGQVTAERVGRAQEREPAVRDLGALPDPGRRQGGVEDGDALRAANESQCEAGCDAD